MKNKLIVIGYIGIKKCYLNVTWDKAVNRFCKDEGITLEKFYQSDLLTNTEIVEFEDEFGAYDIHGL